MFKKVIGDIPLTESDPKKPVPDPEKAYNEALQWIGRCRSMGFAGGKSLKFCRQLGLTKLPPELFQLKALRDLDLCQNQLTALPPEIGGLEALTDLRLSSNQLAALPPEIGRLTALTYLDLSGNKLATLPPEICQLTALTHLYLHDNPGLKLPTEVLGPNSFEIDYKNAKPASPAVILDYFFSHRKAQSIFPPQSATPPPPAKAVDPVPPRKDLRPVSFVPSRTGVPEEPSSAPKTPAVPAPTPAPAPPPDTGTAPKPLGGLFRDLFGGASARADSPTPPPKPPSTPPAAAARNASSSFPPPAAPPQAEKPKPKRDPQDETVRIFVSYARVDKRWLDREDEHNLIPYLIDSIKKQNVVVWYDKELVASEKFLPRILEEIDKADIAILLVSQPFLNSDFIEKHELPRIKERADKKGLSVVPVLVKPCSWEEDDFLSARQMLPGKPTPLINYTGHEADWEQVRFDLLEGIKKLVKKIRTERAKAAGA